MNAAYTIKVIRYDPEHPWFHDTVSVPDADVDGLGFNGWQPEGFIFIDAKGHEKYYNVRDCSWSQVGDQINQCITENERKYGNEEPGPDDNPPIPRPPIHLSDFGAFCLSVVVLAFAIPIVKAYFSVPPGLYKYLWLFPLALVSALFGIPSAFIVGYYAIKCLLYIASLIRVVDRAFPGFLLGGAVAFLCFMLLNWFFGWV